MTAFDKNTSLVKGFQISILKSHSVLCPQNIRVTFVTKLKFQDSGFKFIQLVYSSTRQHSPELFLSPDNGGSEGG